MSTGFGNENYLIIEYQNRGMMIHGKKKEQRKQIRLQKQPEKNMIILKNLKKVRRWVNFLIK